MQSVFDDARAAARGKSLLGEQPAAKTSTGGPATPSRDNLQVVRPSLPTRPPPRTRGWVAAGVAGRLNLVADLLALSAVLVFEHVVAGGHLGFAEVAPFVLLATAVWIVAATAVRHYVPSAYVTQALDDAAMTAVILVATFTSLLVPKAAFRALGEPSGNLRCLILDFGIALALRPIFRWLSCREIPSEDVIVVGGNVRGRLIAKSIERQNGESVLGIVPFDNVPGEPMEIPVLGAYEDLERILRSTPVSKVYIAGNALRDGPLMQQTISLCEQLGVSFALPAYSFRLGRALPTNPELLAHGYVHYSVFEPKLRQRALKRLFDITSSAFALWMLMPLFLFVAALVKLTSRGPIFFKQQRAGINGRPFNMLKFRSMVANAEELKGPLAAANEQSGPVFKMRQDPRVTRLGRFIRKYSIDELPQLINVLRGDMSIVGPRPPVPEEVAKYEAWQLRRLSVRPGLTCLWQVSGRNQVSFEDWMYLDMLYIDHWSLRKDLALIFRTVPVVLMGKGAS